MQLFFGAYCVCFGAKVLSVEQKIFLLAYIVDHIHEQPEVRIKYFVPDERKSGGAILKVDGIVRKVANGVIVTADGLYICIEHMIALDIK